MIFHAVSFGLAATITLIQACADCDGFGQYTNGIMTRLVRREQPEALKAGYGPRAPLEWGQLNFIHTTDTHGWLEGHLKEANYGADWGDFVSFADAMKHKATSLGVDLLIVDTGVNS
jgi:2',3'-cyclic-nucleotide 2'-phosphodiesterase (5'-nucleotidase family)